ncbi:hypothetical protein GCM10010196_31010 [Agromyces mediolanus]|uniref:Uncharacterized protein n=1 Tax=Agromyces mediolanus TaxID=41986 RepID=A0A918FFF3_AGRME|nr:hypothetical protein GCM10010196_31010 [Agromyces mediolanus]GLJ74151.1 hypothetical protein GCM10017583_34100 [Agromyces mediolanus]
MADEKIAAPMTPKTRMKVPRNSAVSFCPVEGAAVPAMLVSFPRETNRLLRRRRNGAGPLRAGHEPIENTDRRSGEAHRCVAPRRRMTAGDIACRIGPLGGDGYSRPAAFNAR